MKGFDPVVLFTAFLLFPALLAPGHASWAQTATHGDSVATADMYYDVGYEAYDAGNLDSALVTFDRALKFDPAHSGAWHGKGSALARLNRHREAQQAFDEALRLKPGFATAWWHRGCDNAVAGRVDTALSDLGHAIEIDPAFKSWPFSDECWKTLWDDPRLLKVTAPYTKENTAKE
jgi:tetratricopeptide (TPR) repeat protein